MNRDQALLTVLQFKRALAACFLAKTNTYSLTELNLLIEHSMKIQEKLINALITEQGESNE